MSFLRPGQKQPVYLEVDDIMSPGIDTWYAEANRGCRRLIYPLNHYCNPLTDTDTHGDQGITSLYSFQLSHSS